MVTVNHNYLKLPGSYLFSNIGKKVAGGKSRQIYYQFRNW